MVYSRWLVVTAKGYDMAPGDPRPRSAKDDPDGLGSYHTQPTDKIPGRPLTGGGASFQTPTVGRVVHYWPCDFGLLTKKGQPYPAMVTHVFNPDCVNLAVATDGSFRLDTDGTVTSVDRCEPTDQPEDRLGKWSWPVKN